MRISFRFYKKGQKGYTLHRSDRTRKMSILLGREKWQKAYIKVTYGKMRNIDGNVVTAYNDGYYTSKKEARNALRAFIEEGKKWEGGEHGQKSD